MDMDKTNQTLLSANIAVWSMVAILAMLTLTGCGSSTGWTVSFGVSPVNSIDNRQILHSGGAIIPSDDKRRY